jgi:mannose-6-phosphate isomerase
MHLFEAMLAWSREGTRPVWAAAADEIANLALTRFIDQKTGVLREFFDADWRPASGDAGRMIEPGHQFEWAGLLNHWAVRNGREDVKAAARKLYEAGLTGVCRKRGVALNGLWDDGSVRNGAARLWVQAEYLKAALIFGDEGEALTAAKATALYLNQPVPGAWRDLMDEGGALVDEPSPASTLYHLVSAWKEFQTS